MHFQNFEIYIVNLKLEYIGMHSLKMINSIFKPEFIFFFNKTPSKNTSNRSAFDQT